MPAARTYAFRAPPGATDGAIPTLLGASSTLSSDVASVDGAFGLGFQKACWSTSDGQRHVIYNRGTLNGVGNSLQLATSSDGVNWTNVLTLPSTGPSSNIDVVQNSSTVYWCAYGDNAGGVRVARLVYAGGGSWSIGTGPETVPLAGGTTGKNPSIQIDGLSSIWVSMQATDGTGTYLKAFRRTGANTYVDSNQIFGTPGSSTATSMRLQKVPGGLFGIWTQSGVLKYQRRNNGDATTAAWSVAVTLYNDDLQLDAFQSEFAVATDSLNNLHVAYSGSGRLLNFRWDAAGTSWSNQFVTFAIGSAFPQAVVSDTDRVWFVTQDQYTKARAYLSTDAGNTYQLALEYEHALGDLSISYPNPRPRALAPVGSATPPILLEYSDLVASREKALAYG